MVWWLGRPSHRTAITDRYTAVGNGVVVRTALIALQLLTEIPL